MPAMEKSVPLAEAKNKLSEYVDRAASGEVIIITKHGGPLAKLVPFSGPSSEDANKAIKDIRTARKKNQIQVTIEELIAWKNEGRP